METFLFRPWSFIWRTSSSLHKQFIYEFILQFTLHLKKQYNESDLILFSIAKKMRKFYCTQCSSTELFYHVSLSTKEKHILVCLENIFDKKWLWVNFFRLFPFTLLLNTKICRMLFKIHYTSGYNRNISRNKL